MENPLSKLAPQFFGEYPKPFLELVENVTLVPEQNLDDVKKSLWKAYEFGERYHLSLIHI